MIGVMSHTRGKIGGSSRTLQAMRWSRQERQSEADFGFTQHSPSKCISQPRAADLVQTTSSRDKHQYSIIVRRLYIRLSNDMHSVDCLIVRDEEVHTTIPRKLSTSGLAVVQSAQHD
jgi:hypothetical protein